MLKIVLSDPELAFLRFLAPKFHGAQLICLLSQERHGSLAQRDLRLFALTLFMLTSKQLTAVDILAADDLLAQTLNLRSCDPTQHNQLARIRQETDFRP